jgi:cell division protein FtsL
MKSKIVYIILIATALILAGMSVMHNASDEHHVHTEHCNH